jgi:lysophospholipase L1-like esterase
VSIQKYVPYRVNSDIIVYNSILELLATRFFLPVADTYTLSLGLDNLRMAPDDVHFKLEGYKVLADYITDVLKSNYGIGE